MQVKFCYQGNTHTLPLIMRPDISAYNGLAVVQYVDDTRPRLQLVSLACVQGYHRVHGLSPLASIFLPDLGTVRFSRTHRRAWLDDGYCHKLTQFEILQG